MDTEQASAKPEPAAMPPLKKWLAVFLFLFIFTFLLDYLVHVLFWPDENMPVVRRLWLTFSTTAYFTGFFYLNKKYHWFD